MERFAGPQGQTVGVQLPQHELEQDPELFYRVLDDCRRIWYKTSIEKLPGRGVRLVSARAWEHAKKTPA